MTDIERLINWLNILSVSVGEEFILASGEKSNTYIDVKKTALHHRCHKLLASLLWNKILKEFGYHDNEDTVQIEAVAGVVLGGCHLASIVAMYAVHDLDVIYVRKTRKDHGSNNLLERSCVIPGQNVVLIEDVVTTGNSSSLAAEILTKEGCNVLGIISVVDRRKEKNNLLNGKWPFISLIDIEQLNLKNKQ